VPPLHILRAQNGLEYRFYELTGDLPEALHFRHFERSETEPLRLGERIRLKGEVQLPDAAPAKSAQGRIRIKEESANLTTAANPATGTIKIEKSKTEADQLSKGSEPPSIQIRSKGADRSIQIKPPLERGQVKLSKL
jgi:hypothetical protein